MCIWLCVFLTDRSVFTERDSLQHLSHWKCVLDFPMIENVWMSKYLYWWKEKQHSDERKNNPIKSILNHKCPSASQCPVFVFQVTHMLSLWVWSIHKTSNHGNLSNWKCEYIMWASTAHWINQMHWFLFDISKPYKLNNWHPQKKFAPNRKNNMHQRLRYQNIPNHRKKSSWKDLNQLKISVFDWTF